MLRTSHLEAPLPLPRARGIYRVKGLGDWLCDLGGIPIIVPFAARYGLLILRQIMFAVPGSEDPVSFDIAMAKPIVIPARLPCIAARGAVAL